MCVEMEKSGAEGSRTLDLCSAIAALSQLSYRPGQFILTIRDSSASGLPSGTHYQRKLYIA